MRRPAEGINAFRVGETPPQVSFVLVHTRRLHKPVLSQSKRKGSGMPTPNHAIMSTNHYTNPAKTLLKYLT